MSDYANNVADNIDRQILFNIPLRKAVVLFSALFFIAIALGSSAAYYFAIRKTLNENLAKELKQTLDIRQLLLRAELREESLLLKVLSENPVIGSYFLEPGNEEARKRSYAIFNYYKGFFNNKMLNWVTQKDLRYYVNGQFMEEYDSSNPRHAWFFEALKNKNPPSININFDYLNRYVYDLYIDYPVYSEGEAIGVISSRISLHEFINDLRLPENVLVFDENGVILGSANENIVKNKENIKEFFGSQGEEIIKKAQKMGKNSSITFNIDDTQYAMNSMERFDLFLIAKDKVDVKKIFKERASIVFFVLLLLMFLSFVVFSIFILRLLKPINKHMISYIEDSLLDELTKLPNRRFYNIKIEDEWNRAVRGKYPLSFLMIDLDKFKLYNDTYGHLEGDRLLREVARVFSYCVNRTSDFAARFGGEEFCVILPNTKIDGARKIAENIRISMERIGKATISIGMVCKIPTLDDNMQEFINQADKKLYEAKNTGRNKVC